MSCPVLLSTEEVLMKRTGRGGASRAVAVSRDGHPFSAVLPVARQVRRHGCVADGTHKGTGSREQPLAQDVRPGESQGRDCLAGVGKKWWGHLDAARWPNMRSTHARS